MGSCTTTFDKTTTRGKQLVITCTKYYCTMPTRKVYIMKENSVAVNRAKRSVGDKPYALWGGGSATIVSPTEENNGDIILAELQCVPSVVGSRVMNINNVKVVNPSNNKRKREEDPLLDPEEEEKRRMRRDRNRLAAAKCRKRRLDQIETLQVEVEGWERRNKKLDDEIAALRAEKDEMAFLLAAHKSSCKLQNNFVNQPVKVEPVMEVHQVFVQVVPEPLMDTTNITATTSTQVTSPKPKRPASLSIPSISTKNIEGIPIDTPSNAILSFDTLMMDGKTGLTPTTILTPLKGMSGSNLNSPTCGSQQRSIIFTPLFSPNTEAH